MFGDTKSRICDFKNKKPRYCGANISFGSFQFKCDLDLLFDFDLFA